MGDIEKGDSDYVEYPTDSKISTQSEYESTEEEQEEHDGIRGKVFISRLNKSSNKSKPKFQSKKDEKVPKDDEEYIQYINEDAKHLISKCRTRSKRTTWYASIFAYMNELSQLYIILFSIATFIVSSIKIEYEPSDYVIIGLSAIATGLESAQLIFKYKKRSIYFKQASIQYKRIYRRLNKYLYTANTDTMANYLSLAYQDFDKLALNDNRANFNKFKSYTLERQKEKYT